MTRRDLLAVGALALVPPPAFAAERVDVRQAGARGDGETLDTHAFNTAIRSCARAGGGTVVIPRGRYLCFSIRLASRVSLLFEPGAVLVCGVDRFATGHCSCHHSTHPSASARVSANTTAAAVVWGFTSA